MKAVQEKLAKCSKLNLADTLMVNAINEYKTFTESEIVTKSSVKDELIKTWLEAETKQTIQQVREIQYQLNKVLYSIVVGQVWFVEFSSLEDNEMTLLFNGVAVKCQTILSKKEIAI